MRKLNAISRAVGRRRTLPVTSSGVRSTSGATQGSMEAAAATPCAAPRTIDTC